MISARSRRCIATANAVKLRSLALYRYGATIARERGILIADTKFEFGMLDGEVTLIDEVLTPDSSRFWPASEYAPGHEQPSFGRDQRRGLGRRLWDRVGPRRSREVVEPQAEHDRAADAVGGSQSARQAIHQRDEVGVERLR